MLKLFSVLCPLCSWCKTFAAVFILLFSSAVSAAGADDRSLYVGEPKVQSRKLVSAMQVLDNPGFRIGYSEQHRQPLWVAFRAASVKGRPRLGERPAHFEPDPRVKHPVSSWDYAGRKGESKYDRGHLAPNYLIGKLYGREAQLATFRMSNISPQSERLNKLVWQRLEEAEVDIVAPAMKELWVLTGPVFGQTPAQLKSGIAIPEAFYRIWLDVQPAGELRVLSFIVPQQVCGTEPLSQFLSNVDTIERRTGLDFHAELEDGLEAQLESGRDTSGWPLVKIDRNPPRYADKFGKLEC